ncbi:hypothetical protein OIU77_004319 [Salix suchowensis]|uniref:ELMO domain-containing protein n=1 Tax=Salix suchowensis TaxID=1278906 RepID=A0ABQ9AU14_9ROSI|nr:hypothetical protein OIU77_004319 [Salix suchowensis]
MRRRLHHGDVDGKRHGELFDSSEADGLSEPLLGNRIDDSSVPVPTLEDIWDDDERRKQHIHWTFCVFAIDCAVGAMVSKYCARKLLQPSLSPLQEARLRDLQKRLGVPFDGSRAEHQDALKQLWRLAYPDRELPSLKSELWKDMGWQGSDPSTDFRGGGFISLENLIFFAKKYPDSFQRLLNKRDGTRAEWEYPFAVAGVNISFMLAQMLDLQTGKPSTLAGVRFLELLADDEMAFDNLYCIVFLMMDAQWLAKRASYMEFNDVLKSTRTQIERELSLEDVYTVKDLPAYNMLTG